MTSRRQAWRPHGAHRQARHATSPHSYVGCGAAPGHAAKAWACVGAVVRAHGTTVQEVDAGPPPSYREVLKYSFSSPDHCGGGFADEAEAIREKRWWVTVGEDVGVGSFGYPKDIDAGVVWKQGGVRSEKNFAPRRPGIGLGRVLTFYWRSLGAAP